MSVPAVYTVYGGEELRDFVRFPYTFYKSDPRWLPPPAREIKKTLNRKKNPFFHHAEAEYYVAREGRKTVGRIAAMIDHEYNNEHGVKTGWFGLFESVDDPDVARALMRAACGWLRDRGMENVLGPASLTPNGHAGLLLEEYGEVTDGMTAYNPPYYLRLVEGEGFIRDRELLAWRMPTAGPVENKPGGWSSLLGGLMSLFGRRGPAGGEVRITNDDDGPANSGMETAGAKVFGRYRVYGKSL